MKRLLTTSGIMAFAVAAFALGSFARIAQETYKFSGDSEAGKAKCMLCHTSKMGGKLNAYGTDLKTALNGSKKLTAEVLHSIDAKDSNKDGTKNGDALKAGKLP